MDRFFSVLQTTASCFKWSKTGFGPSLSGVTQGIVLNPLLFSFYINDISTDIDSEIRLFATEKLEQVSTGAQIPPAGAIS